MKSSLLQDLGQRLTHSQNVLTRRWYIVAATLVLMFPALLFVHNAPGVYYSTVSLLFLPPAGSVGGGNSLRADPGGTVHYAALIERRFNEGRRSFDNPRPTNAPLYATGIKHGTYVHLPDAGGQWQSNFNRAELRVEVVGQSEQEVLDNMNRTLATLQKLSVEPQKEMGIWEESMITNQRAPAVPAVGYAWVRNPRADMAVAALMLGLSVAAAHIGDAIIGRIRKSRSSGTQPRASGHPQAL